MTLSVVIPTKNEAANIAACIRAFDGVRDRVEVIVVDNASTDGTPALAAKLGARVFEQGPERCAQRNRGGREATGDVLLFVDADMTLPAATIDEILARCSPATPSGTARQPPCLYIPEQRVGTGLRLAARNFERSFYDGTAIDALRLFRRSLLAETGGYDENLIAGPEDWELDIRVLATGAKCAVLKRHLIHNEKRLSFRRMLAKKAYYSKSMAAYRAKWKGHPALKRQFGVLYRYVGVFVECGKWRRLLRHPILAVVMYLERIAVGVTYLCSRRPAANLLAKDAQ